MPRNVEIKARIESVSGLIPRVAAIADNGPIEIIQDDTFFKCEIGRLKLRTISKQEGELIFYRRANEKGPKESFYLCSRTSTPDILRESLSQAYGKVGRVQKRRLVFYIGRTRVHLDAVEHLGHFLEFEVVLRDDEAATAGMKEAEILLERLGIESSQLIEHAYVDLMERRSS